MSPRLSFNVLFRKVPDSACLYCPLLLLLLFNPLNNFAAVPGVLDPAFGTGGIVSTPVGASSNGQVVLVQPDGKIVTAGEIFTVMRYLNNATRDFDYDSDARADISVFRPSNGAWYRINSGSNTFSAHQFGIAGDKPFANDYDGDGKADLVVFRPSTGTWYLLRSTAGFTGLRFGANGDIPTPSAFVR